MKRSSTWKSLCWIVVALALAVSWPRAASGGVAVPTQLQAQLLSRLAAFDRNFVARAGPLARVLVVYKPRDQDSSSVANSVAKALAGADLAGVKTDITTVEYPGPEKLAARCKSDKVAVVYFGPGLEAEMASMARALAGSDVMSVGGSSTHAERGAAVGFDVEEGRPKIVVNLRVAKAQNVAFKAELLKLARVIE